MSRPSSGAEEAEAAYRSDASRLIGETLLDASDDAFYVLDRDWRFVYLNDAAERLIRRSREELLGHSIWDEFPEAVGTPGYHAHHRAFDEGEPVAFEEYYAPLETWFEARAYPRDGLLVVHARSIGPRKEAQAALRESEERWRFLVKAAEVLTSTLDYRQRLHDLARLCAGPLSDYCIVDVVEDDGTIRRIEVAHADPEKEELVRELLRFPPTRKRDGGAPKALTTGEPVLIERVDGEELERIAQSDEHLDILRALAPRAYLVVPLRAKGETLGAITLAMAESGRSFGEEDIQLARDLARQAALDLHNARLHRDVERARQAAEESSHTKGQFLAMMSHELRTPLTAIIGFSDLIESEASGPVTAKQKEQIARIKASAWHLVVLIDEILAHSRMEAGAEEPRLETTDAAHLARDVARLFRPHALTHGLTLRCEIPEEPVVVETDPGKVRQILTNLLGNAIKFTEEGEVLLELRRQEGFVELRVRDTGPGIDEADRERIFDPFVQIQDATTRRHGGTGLGLAISRRYARMLGGDIEVESASGRGSTFTVRLPTS